MIEAKQDKGQHGSARYLFAALRPFFKWAAEHEICPVSPLEGVTPPKPLEERDRVLSEAEVKSFWIATASDPIFGPFYRLLLLTAQRREEVSDMRWSELNLDAGVWTIAKERTKNKKEHVVHLSPQALAIIEAVPKNGSECVFATVTGKAGLRGYGNAKARLDKNMDDPKPWRVHDLRRTAASGMASLGFQPHIIERVLNHISGAQGGLVGVYQRYEYQEDLVCAWGNHVEGLISDKPAIQNVIPLRA